MAAVLDPAHAAQHFPRSDNSVSGISWIRLIISAAIACCSIPVSSQARSGISPLDAASYEKAIADGKTGHEPVLNVPLLIRAQAGTMRIEVATSAPFSFHVESPYTRVHNVVNFAVSKYREPKPPSMAEANARGVVVFVTPGQNFLRSDAIERVVIERGDRRILPSAEKVAPSLVRNGFGAVKELSEGEFTFPIEAFAPAGGLTFVLVGRSGNIRIPMTESELAMFR